MNLSEIFDKYSDLEYALACLASGVVKIPETIEWLVARGWDRDYAVERLHGAAQGSISLYHVVECMINIKRKRLLRQYQARLLADQGIVPRSREHFVFYMGVVSVGDPHEQFEHVTACHFDERLDHFYQKGREVGSKL